MGDILSKLQMVSEKIGVTETAHTIEEQVDLISESLDKIPASTNIAEALDDLSEVAQNINNEEVYVDKTITANGEYLPAEDEATAYSKIVANIPPYFSEVRAFLPDYNGVDASIVILDSPDGNYVLDNNQAPNNYYINRNCLISPASSIKMTILGTVSVTFTPAESFNVNNITDGNQQVSISGDEVTPGDGKLYQLYINGHNDTGTITKYDSNNDYASWVTINPVP